jgi:hypothetical protein
MRLESAGLSELRWRNRQAGDFAHQTLEATTLRGMHGRTRANDWPRFSTGNPEDRNRSCLPLERNQARVIRSTALPLKLAVKRVFWGPKRSLWFIPENTVFIAFQGQMEDATTDQLEKSQ